MSNDVLQRFDDQTAFLLSRPVFRLDAVARQAMANQRAGERSALAAQQPVSQ